ncbi:hypothetical protein GDO86_013955 [Hymenochirus boettgeri]|uniref:MYCBP-associated protein n=1 Tax=Hymenochirus boettgeri TaxID=247094 RepID=A0A8T2JM14_9PIPI|nr:hypothetical protein GDO86_013955 [Hymenochirus boettgeri]
MANRTGRRESTTKTPTGRKKQNGLEQPTPPPIEEPGPDSKNVLKGDEIQALAINLEELQKVHPPRLSVEEPNDFVTRQILIRKPMKEERKRRLLVARPVPPELEGRDLDYSVNEFSFSGSQSQIQPHHILGTLQDYKREALARGNTQIAALIPDPESNQNGFRSYSRSVALNRKDDSLSPKQDSRLTNWQHHMDLRRREVESLSRQLDKPPEKLVMNLGEGFRNIQEEKQLIDQCINAAEHGKGRHLGSEFWNLPQRIGDELGGLMFTLPRSDHGNPMPFTRIGKPHGIRKETGATVRSPYDCTWEKSHYLQWRRQDLKSVMEELNFPKPDIDGLEVIGRGQPFTSVSVEQFRLNEEEEEASSDKKENLDPLKDFPDVVPEFFSGPSLLFCGQLAQWVEDDKSHQDESRISSHITFEALEGDKVSSVLEVLNNGTCAIWYKWRRLPPVGNLLKNHRKPKVQRFYFNTNSGVILPGETQHFTFHFKSSTAGIFRENWEFCTHPVLLAGAPMQVSLWGVALYEDKAAPLREELKRKMENGEAVIVAQQMVEEILCRVRTPERPLSPARHVTEEEEFNTMNPKLWYKHQTVQELKKLWSTHNPSHVREEQNPFIIPPISLFDTLCPSESVEDSHNLHANYQKSWNLSVKDLNKVADSITDDAERETFLSQLNKAIIELSEPPKETQAVDNRHEVCLQLWREAVEELVEWSLVLHNLLGIPEKDVTVEDTALKPGGDPKSIKAGREDKKTVKEREDQKGGKTGIKEKEDRPSSRKVKRKEEKKTEKGQTLSDVNSELVSSGESLDPSSSYSQLVDPVVQKKYKESLYIEVYGLLVKVIEDMVTVLEDPNPSSSTIEEENVT